MKKILNQMTGQTILPKKRAIVLIGDYGGGKTGFGKALRETSGAEQLLSYIKFTRPGFKLNTKTGKYELSGRMPREGEEGVSIWKNKMEEPLSVWERIKTEGHDLEDAKVRANLQKRFDCYTLDMIDFNKVKDPLYKFVTENEFDRLFDGSVPNVKGDIIGNWRGYLLGGENIFIEIDTTTLAEYYEALKKAGYHIIVPILTVSESMANGQMELRGDKPKNIAERRMLNAQARSDIKDLSTSYGAAVQRIRDSEEDEVHYLHTEEKVYKGKEGDSTNGLLFDFEYNGEPRSKMVIIEQDIEDVIDQEQAFIDSIFKIIPTLAAHEVANTGEERLIESRIPLY